MVTDNKCTANECIMLGLRQFREFAASCRLASAAAFSVAAAHHDLQRIVQQRLLQCVGSLLNLAQMPANANSGRSSTSANQATTSFLFGSGLVSGAYSAKLFAWAAVLGA
jgi:hypothetical protein